MVPPARHNEPANNNAVHPGQEYHESASHYTANGEVALRAHGYEGGTRASFVYAHENSGSMCGHELHAEPLSKRRVLDGLNSRVPWQRSRHTFEIKSLYSFGGERGNAVVQLIHSGPRVLPICAVAVA